MLNFWKRQYNGSDTSKLLRKFVRLVIVIDDTPTLIRRVAEHKQFMLYCSVAIKAETNPDSIHRRLYRDLERETQRQGFSFESLKKKLSPLADALGLHVQVNESNHADYYQTLGVPQNAGIDTIKKAFRAKARLTHPDKISGEKDRFLDVLEAYKVLSNPSFRRDYNLNKKQEPKREWSENARNEDENLKKPRIHKYGVHFFLIVLLLIITALFADFVIRERALFEGAHKTVTVKRPLLLEKIHENELSVGTHNVESGREKETLNEKLKNFPVEEDHNSHHVSNKDQGKQIPNDEKLLTENILNKESLKIVHKKYEKKIETQISNNPKIAPKTYESSSLYEEPDSITSEIMTSPENASDVSNLVKSTNQIFPDLKIINKPDETVSENVLLRENLQINYELEQFLLSYCGAYESRDLKKFRRFFAEDAIENGIPINQLLPKYQKNFQNLSSIQYRISIENYILTSNAGLIEVNGLFFLRWQKKQEKQWHNYSGNIRLTLISENESFLNDSFSIYELNYQFID
jgi:curved DNA-binding protein CbpA